MNTKSNTKKNQVKENAMNINEDLTKFKAMKAVYSYVYPEVRPIIEKMGYIPIELFLTSTPVGKAQDIIDGLGFRKRFVVPRNSDGNVSLDDIHEPIIDRLVEEYEDIGKVVSGLKDFGYRYPTSGSSQGIFHLLADLKQKGLDKIYMLKGEYEGYREYGNTLGIKTVEIDSLNYSSIKRYKPGVWFISNPSARDGNIIPNEYVMNLCEAGHKVILDLAYVGMTKDYKFNLDHENIVGTVMSLSKPYGLFRFRTGITFTKEPVDSLYANKWFKDVGRLLLGLKVVEDIGVHKLHDKYVGFQSHIIRSLNDGLGLDIKQSDVFLLGYTTVSGTKDYGDKKLSLISSYRRSDNYRFCLTPYFEELEKNAEMKRTSEVSK
jgi:hypothetical protein